MTTSFAAVQAAGAANMARRTAGDEDRAAQIQGLRDLACWLEANPGAPMRRWGTEIQVNPGGTGEVLRVAGELGIGAEDKPYLACATKRFGLVAYVLYAPSAPVTYGPKEPR